MMGPKSQVLKITGRVALGALVAAALASCTQGTLGSKSANSVSAQAPKAKNVIMFIGDGMGVSTVTAMRIYMGQLAGGPGEDHVLPFETFDNVALVKTYNTNQQVADSAGTASAIHTGVKTRAGVINVGPAAGRGNCARGKANALTSIGDIAADKGYGVGIVSTARITHATPATVYAQSATRSWEWEGMLSDEARANGCKDIAAQLLDFPFAVALGGGVNAFGDMPQQWAARTGGTFAQTKSEMDAAPAGRPLLGLFSPSHMTYEAERMAGNQEPDLEAMTRAAITRLAASDTGYYLMVEGGRIDHGHHDGKAGYALEEGRAFVEAIAAAMEMTNPDDTLIMVTADHSHAFTIGGYPTRGNPILGLSSGNGSDGEPTGKLSLDRDGVPFSVLGYQNGPGADAPFRSSADAPVKPGADGIRNMPETGTAATQQALVRTGYVEDGEFTLSESHGGEDVAVYAHGPGAGQVKGVMEQNLLFNVMMDAFGWEN